MYNPDWWSDEEKVTLILRSSLLEEAKFIFKDGTEVFNIDIALLKIFRDQV